MRSSLILLLLTTWVGALSAQNHQAATRTTFDPVLHPFLHGVASGDPLADRVIIWTRLTSSSLSGTVNVDWEMATDTNMTNVVQSGSAATNAAKDWTVKVDVTGLQPGSVYYYQFTYNGRKSLIGRTKTAPTGNVDRLRFAFTSCQAFTDGYYYAWRSLSERPDDIDAVFMLGDYIYEYGNTSDLPDRDADPAREIVTLADYRARYNQYRLDPDLRRAHQQFPFIAVWDDHETTDNSWRDGASNHQPNEEGPWPERKQAGIRAYYEWLPVRVQNPADSTRIYRSFEYGDLAELFFLDTRLYDRDEQAEASDSSAITDTSRTLLGDQQRQWLLDGLSASTAQWKILPQQVMFAPLNIAVDTVLLGVFPLDTAIVNTDQWDGYPHVRQSILDHLVNNNIDNTIVLTGDIHTSWAMDVPQDFDTYAAGNPGNSAAVEFVVTSISTGSLPINIDTTIFGIDVLSLVDGILPPQNPHIKYYNLSRKGFNILDLDANRAQCDFFVLDNITNDTYTPAYVEESWQTPNGANQLAQAAAPAPLPNNPPAPAPLTVNNTPTSMAELGAEVLLMYAYPNPTVDYLQVDYLAEGLQPAQLRVLDLKGRVVRQQDFQPEAPGLNTLRLDLSQLPSGAYLLEMCQNDVRMLRKVIKR